MRPCLQTTICKKTTCSIAQNSVEYHTRMQKNYAHDRKIVGCPRKGGFLAVIRLCRKWIPKEDLQHSQRERMTIPVSNLFESGIADSKNLLYKRPSEPSRFRRLRRPAVLCPVSARSISSDSVQTVGRSGPG